MKASLTEKLEHIIERVEELNALVSDPDVINEQNRYRQLTIELAELNPVVEEFQRYRGIASELEEAEAMANDDDASIRDMAAEEIPGLKDGLGASESALQRLLLPKDPNDERNIFLEIRAGTGGDEAAIFAGDLFRMYQIYAESRRWKVEILSESQGEHGGYKEIISRLVGRGAYSQLKFESGTHRVQRVPETESQGRIHTSACTVAVLPEADEIDDVDINSNDLKIDTYRASGAGGQHVNKTDSAVRITHLPTGIVVECQDERSQHKNRARAMSVLHARLLDKERSEQKDETDAARKNLVGSGDRSERIRTYNFPQGRVTDHRINLTLYKLEEVIGGDLDHVVQPLIAEHTADLLATLGE